MKKLFFILFILFSIFPATAQKDRDKYEWYTFEEIIWNSSPDEVKEDINHNTHLIYDTVR